MPETIKLPNGETLTFPDGMSLEDKNAVYTEAISQIKVEKPVAIGIPGVVTPRKVPASTFRGATNLGGEVIGGTLGAIAGAPGGPFGAIAGAAAGSIGGRKGAQKLQGVMGVEPSKYTTDDAIETALFSGIGEGVGRLPFAAWRGIKSLVRAGADTGAARANQKLLFELGVENPRLDLLLTDAGAKFDFGAIKQWASKNPFSSKIMKAAADETAEDMAIAFERRWMTRGEIPDIEMAGEAFREGLERINPAWREIGNAKYSRFWGGFGRGEKVAWDSTKIFLEGRASLDDVLNALVTDKTKSLHQALSNKYVQTFVKSLPRDPAGSLTMEIVRPMPFEQMQALRTQVGHLISDWGPTSQIPRSELKGLYGALTDDMRVAAKARGMLDQFDEANKYWSQNLERQEKVFDRIDGALKSDAEVGQGVEKLMKTGRGQGDSRRIMELKTSFGAGSDEWGVIKNYLMRDLGTGTDGNFNIRNVYTKWNRLSKSSKRALLGDGPERQAMDNYLKAVEKFGYGIVDIQRSPLSRWTKAEIFGPVAPVIGGAGLLTGAGLTASGKEGAGVPLVIASTLALISPYAAARLITSQKWTNWAIQAGSKRPEIVAGSLSRLMTQFGTASPDEQAAAMEFFTAFGDMFPDQQQGGIPPQTLTYQSNFPNGGRR